MPFIPARDAVSFLSTAAFDELAEFAGRIETLMARLANTEPEIGTSNRPTKNFCWEA